MRNVAVTSFVALALVACGTTASNEDYDEVAAGLGALTAENGGGDARSMSDSVVLLRGEVPFGLSATASGSFTGLHGGLMYDYTLTCRDASAAPMAACDATTSSGRLTVAWSGELVTPSFSGSLSRSGDWRVMGLQTNVATFDGAGSFDVSASWSTLRGMRSYELSYDAQYFAIGFETTGGHVVSGSARYDVHARRMVTTGGRHAEAEFDVEVMVTFDADGTATMILDGAHRYSLDVSTGAVVRIER